MDFGALPPEINSHTNVRRCRRSTPDGRRGDVERPGRRVEHYSIVRRVGDHAVDYRTVAGSGVDVDGRCCPALFGLVDLHR